MNIGRKIIRVVGGVAAAAALTGLGGGAAHAADYKLPYPAGESYKVTQGNFGAYSHTGAYNQYAWDFAMPNQYEVSATQAGTIHKSGWSPYWQNGIEVLVRHSNGQCTHYAHLSRAIYNSGTSVPQGRIIGWSGNTGASSGAHLHYQVIDCNTRVGKPSTLQGSKPGVGAWPKSTNTKR